MAPQSTEIKEIKEITLYLESVENLSFKISY